MVTNYLSRTFNNKKVKQVLLFIAVILFSNTFHSYATHIVGGELNYKCLGGNQYQIKLTVYRDCYTGVPPFDNPAAVGIFDNNNVLVTTVFLNFPGSTVLPPTVAQADVCVKTPSNICVEVAQYVGTVTLPPRAGGYQLAYQRCCRNPTVDNITNPGSQGATYYARIPDQSVACNSNPVFKNWPPIFVCANNQIIFDHSATDADGDVIVYSLCSPLDGASSGNSQPSPPSAPPYNSITWKAPYSASNPLGGNTLTIDPNTGLMTGTPTTQGQFVVGVCADEYRNGVLISTTKRDFQFNVINCQPDIVAASIHATTNCTTHLVTFTNNSTGSNNFFWDFGDLTKTNDTSRVKNPTYTYPAVGTYTVTLIAFSSINSKCNDTLKSYLVTVADCPPCTMTLATSKVDATCGSSMGSGCVHILYTEPCVAGQTLSMNYATASVSGSCGGGTASISGGGGAPTSAILKVNGTTLPNPTDPPESITVTTYTTQATCPKSAQISSAGGVATFDYYLWLGSAASPGSATVTPSGGTGPYTYAWTPGGANTATAGGLTAGTYTVTVTDNSGCQKTGSVIINSTSAMTVTTGVTSPTTCSGSDGSASVTAASGVGPYTYLWLPGGQTTATATGLSAGVYTVNVNDNGCSVTTSVTINPPIVLTVGTSKTNVKCNGNNGTITANPSGGSGTYTYSWSNGQTTKTISNLTAGTYTVTATDSGGCRGTASVNINDNSLTLVSASTSPTCGGTGGTASITASGGTAAYNYSWNSSPAQTTASVSGLPSGDYVGTVTDGAGCIDTVMVSINEPPELLPEPKNTSTVNCAGVPTGSAHVDVSGGTAGFTYSWNNGATTQDITGLTAGTYIITVTDSKGCTATNSVAVTLPSPLSATYLPSNITTCFGDNTGAVTVNPSGGNPGYTYSWNTVPVQTTQSITGLTAGTYTVVVTDIAGCTTALTNVVVSQPAIVSLTTGSTPVGCVSSNGTASVTAAGGTGAYSYVWSPVVATTATATGLSAGTYSITVTDANGCSKNTSVNVSNSGIPTSSITSQSNVGCTGGATGSATVTGSGGTPGYTYSWSPGGNTDAAVTGLTSGTYSVTITDSFGCSVLQTVAITQPASGLGSGISAQSNVNCTGNATGSATVSGSGGTPGYTYLWSPGGTTDAAVTGLTAGTYSVTLTDLNGCTKLQTVSITQPASSVSAGATSTDATCGVSNGTATVTAAGGTPAYTFLWSTGLTTSTITNLSSGSYDVTVTDGNGCTKFTSVSVNNATGPTVGIASQSDVLCNGLATGSATVTGTGGTGTLTYSWNNGVTSTTGSSGGLSAGTYIVTVTDANGCAQGQTVVIGQPSSVVGSVISSQLNVGCTGNATGSATVTGTGGTPGYTYAWSTGATTDGITGLSAGTYTVSITDANGCTAVKTVAITQPASSLGSTASAVDAACGGSDGSATVTVTGGTSGYFYSWAPYGGTNATAANLSSGTYVVTITDSNGCTSTASAAVNNLPGPTASISSQFDVKCYGSATGSATATGNGGTPNYTYTWSVAGQTNPTITGLTAGTYSVIVTDNNGCSATQSVTITQPVSAVGSTILTQSDAKCYGNASGSATVTGTGGTPNYTYSWSVAGQTNPTITGLTAGTYSVVVTDNNGCTATQNVTISQPVAAVTPIPSTTNAACGSSNGTASITASGGTPNYTYSWSVGGQTNPTITGLTAGTYSVTVTDANGCTQTANATVNGSPGPSASISSSTNVTCNGLNNGTATVNVTSGTSPYIYIWNPNVTTNNSISGLSPGTYTVVVTDFAGCSSTTQVTITEPPPFTLTVTSSGVLCAGEAITLVPVTSGGSGSITFTWTPTGPVVSPLVQTTYSVTGTDNNGCLSSIGTITIVPLLSPVAGFDTVSSGTFNQKYNFSDLSTNGTTWYWDFGDGTTSISQNPFHTFTAGTFTVTQVVTSSSGCTDTITKVVVILPRITIPNVFTPNGDGINDDFWIPNTGFDNFNLDIYDRWGLKLFSTDVGEIRWDGHTMAGQIVPDGTYYYLLTGKLKSDAGGEDYNAKGFINLSRGGGQ